MLMVVRDNRPAPGLEARRERHYWRGFVEVHETRTGEVWSVDWPKAARGAFEEARRAPARSRDRRAWAAYALGAALKVVERERELEADRLAAVLEAAR